jgi:cysteinyl-tRNA synthetase
MADAELSFRNRVFRIELMKRKIILLQGILILLISCTKEDYPGVDFRQEMRDFVIGISHYSRVYKPGFIVIPQNGIELATANGAETGSLDSAYMSVIDGHGQEDLFWGYARDDKATSSRDNSYLRTFLNKSKNKGKTILVTDYCSTHSNMDNSYIQNNSAGYISFAANQRELNNIPAYPVKIYGENNNLVTNLSEVKNFLYLINSEIYLTKADFINAVKATNYDLLIMDFFFNDITVFTTDEINQLRIKANGGKRLVISYLSIGEAENYRYYWQPGWHRNNPAWLDKENPHWAGNYKVRYWMEEWQSIIFGNDDSYLKKILDTGFDGVYLDIIDAYEYFE